MNDSWKRDADAITIQHHFHDFWASRWGGVEKMKKNVFPLGRCRRMHFWRSHAAWGSQKNDPHAAWEGRNWELRHLSSENADFDRSSDFCCCGFWSILGRQTGILAGEFKGKLENGENYDIFWKLWKSKMLFKSLVGARFRSEEVTTTNNSIWGP